MVPLSSVHTSLQLSLDDRSGITVLIAIRDRPIRIAQHGSYRYGASHSESDPFEEHQIVLEQTAGFPMPAGFMLAVHNRGDLRSLNSDFSSRYRPRLRIERQVEVWNMSLLP